MFHLDSGSVIRASVETRVHLNLQFSFVRRRWRRRRMAVIIVCIRITV
jgi:hypothetical protein